MLESQVFLNKVTRANVDVQPYPFTTKSLFVGHTDYQYLRWQVIDTPGILDHPLEERNTIEMQSITALAHLRAAVLYLIDVSEQCGYSIKQQVELFNSIKPLFTNTPIIVVANKIDVVRIENLNPEDKAAIDSIVANGAILVPMSTMSEEGVSTVKQIACDKLLEQRVETKIKSKKSSDVLNRLHVAMPAPRDDKVRGPVVPDSVVKSKEMEIDTHKKEVETGEDPEDNQPFWLRGFNSLEWRKKYKLKDDEWRFDPIPEIIDGKNIADFIDPEILQRLDELDREEDERIANAETAMEEDDEDDLDEEDMKKVQAIRTRRKLVVLKHRENKGTHLPHSKFNKEGDISQFESHLAELGIDPTSAAQRLRSRSRSSSRAGRKRTRSESAADDTAVSKLRRTSSKTPASEGLRDIKQKLKVEKLVKNTQKPRNKLAKKGEGDRVILNLMPKHLFSGKRGAGKTTRR